MKLGLGRDIFTGAAGEVLGTIITSIPVGASGWLVLKSQADQQLNAQSGIGLSSLFAVAAVAAIVSLIFHRWWIGKASKHESATTYLVPFSISYWDVVEALCEKLPDKIADVHDAQEVETVRFLVRQIGEGKSTNDILLNFQGRNRDLLPLLRATKKSLKRRLREEHRLMKELSERIERKVGAS